MLDYTIASNITYRWRCFPFLRNPPLWQGEPGAARERRPATVPVGAGGTWRSGCRHCRCDGMLRLPDETRSSWLDQRRVCVFLRTNQCEFFLRSTSFCCPCNAKYFVFVRVHRPPHRRFFFDARVRLYWYVGQPTRPHTRCVTR